MKKLILIIFLFSITANAQNTVGTILNKADSYDGYTLFAPNNSTSTYLINNCGVIVNQWNSSFNPGNAVYLLENGNLLRTGRIINDNITIGGIGGALELYDWDGNILWNYTYSSPTFTQHHDIYPLPNGNILILSLELMTEAESIQAGRDPDLLEDGRIYNEQILELEPVGTNQANIVWEWNIKDHLIQDHDSTKDNFGVIANNPQRLNFNYTNTAGSPENWLHCNSMQYNETLDQIILSSRVLSEIYIIDHSTTTAQAAGTTGGIYGKGGDLLFRWGNKEAYNKGDADDRTLFGQHYPHWIPDGLTDAGKIIIYNNGSSTRPYSSIDIIDPEVSTPGNYIYDSVNGYGPTNAEYSYTAPVNTDFFSSILSSAQRLPNGNTLICDGDSGYFFEIDSDENIVWEYINPDGFNGVFSQGETASLNFVFRAERFSSSYAAFNGRDLTPTVEVELNPEPSNCALLSVPEYDTVDTKIYPNPTTSIVNISSAEAINKVEVYNLLGAMVCTIADSNTIDLSHLNSGLYILKILADTKIISRRIIKE